MLLLLVLVSTTAFAKPSHVDQQWAQFKERHSKKYASMAEENHRREVWKEEMEMVDSHNKEAEEGLHTYTMGENEFSDLTLQEFLDTMTGYNESLDFDVLSDPTLEGKFQEDTFGFPQSWDCRDHGLVSTVRSQGSCGSCWAFAAVGAVEGAWAKEKGQLYRLSEQELIDCDKSDGGCHGGGISSALTWVHNHRGLAKNADYGVGHYHPSQGNCHHKEEETVASLKRVRHVASKNEADLKRAVHNAGPVAMSVHVNKKFKAYKSGIFNDPTCPKNSANHAMLTVGWKYSTKEKKTKWIVKNSWGKSWGQGGYIYLEYGKNVCGMAKSPLYAEV